MNLNIKTSNLELTPAVREYVEEKIGSLDKFIQKFEEMGDIKVEVEIGRTTKHHKKGDVFRAEANLHLPKKILRTEHSAEDIRTAIDKVKDKLKLEIQKYKELSQGF